MHKTRQTCLSGVRTAVIKLGSQLLTDREGKLDVDFISDIARQIVKVNERGIRVAIVSSGAIGAGLCEMKLSRRPTDLARLQAVAAIGQRRLMDAWAIAFAPFDRRVAQILLTREDIDNRTRFLNVRNTIHALHEMGAVPVINENDTISTDEIVRITFGDNDILASLVTNALRADLLILLSGVDGLLDASGGVVSIVEDVDRVHELVRAEKSALGKGGMSSKISAARAVTEAGESLVIANGRTPDILPRILDAELVGTLFVPARRKRPSRSRWIRSVRPCGTITLDEGAAKAVSERNKSLLPAGIIGVDGHFEPGDVVALASAGGLLIARGLSNYSADDVRRIQGKKTQEVRSMLKEAAYDEVVHRNNLALERRVAAVRQDA